jgi:membrane-associated phospholipid phosphatase
MAPRNPLYPADRIIAFYNVVMAVLWLVFVTRAWYAPMLVLAHIVGLLLPWLWARVPMLGGRVMRFLRELYPLLLLAVFWTELDLVRPALGLTGIDEPIAALDRLMFGMALHEVWLPTMGALWMSEVMHLFYYAYYLAAFVPPIALALMARYPAVRDMTFRLTLTYVSCYFVYIAFPVDGPHFLMERTAGVHTQGFFYGLVEAAQTLGDSRGCSFPSSHVAVAVMAAMLGWRWLPRWLAVILWIEAVGVLTSTTYTQHHYAIDSVAGVAWALLVWLAADPLYRLLGGRATETATKPG